MSYRVVNHWKHKDAFHGGSSWDRDKCLDRVFHADHVIGFGNGTHPQSPNNKHSTYSVGSVRLLALAKLSLGLPIFTIARVLSHHVSSLSSVSVSEELLDLAVLPPPS